LGCRRNDIKVTGKNAGEQDTVGREDNRPAPEEELKKIR